MLKFHLGEDIVISFIAGNVNDDIFTEALEATNNIKEARDGGVLPMMRMAVGTVWCGVEREL